MDEEKEKIEEQSQGREKREGQSQGKEKREGQSQGDVQVRDYDQEIVGIIRAGLSPMLLREKVLSYHENDIAEALPQLTADERSRLFSVLDSQTLTDILDYAEDVGKYFGEMNIKKQLEILGFAEADTAIRYLRELPKTERKTLIDLMDDDDKKDIALIGSFDEDEIGSKMTTNYIRIPVGISVREAMRELVEQAAEHDNISTLYVVDKDGVFYGAIDLKDLIIAREGATLRSLMRSSYPYVYAHEQVDDCIERIKAYYEDSIPVLDDNNRLVGVITAPDVVEVVDEAMGDDYAKFAGLSSEEDLKEPVFKSMGKRLPWLIVLLFLALIVSSVVGIFEGVVARLTLIISFQSLVLDMAGNVGTQSLAVTIRVLMDENLTGRQKLGLVLKEARVGLLNGMVLGTGSFVLIGLFVMFAKGRPAPMAFGVSACTGIALMISMVLSSLAGTTIPMLFKKLKVDPAVASGPLITTINDLVAVVVYYGMAWLLLINFMKL